MIKSAVISEDGKYRYRLYRQWHDTTLSHTRPRLIMWMMLNPSSANSEIDDPTIRRCIQFSKDWGYDGMWVGNLFAIRSSDPRILYKLSAEEACGPDNNVHCWKMSLESERLVMAWGSHGGPHVPLTLYVPMEGFWCLGKTLAGAPRHPLYLKKTTQLLPI